MVNLENVMELLKKLVRTLSAENMTILRLLVLAQILGFLSKKYV